VKAAFILALALAAAGQAPADRAGPPPTAEARAAIHAFGRCVARHSPALAAETLAGDFTTRAYRSRLRVLARVNESCFRERGSMRSDPLLFAGAIAEALLADDPAALNVRLARAATGPATPAWSPTDRIAICVVRSVPDDVARLFAAGVASAAETAAMDAIEPVLSACNRTGRPLAVSHAGLRAMLATAAFRSVRGAAPAGERGS